jgi:hypothetical protein
MVVKDTCEGDVVFRNHGTAIIIEYSSAGRLGRHGWLGVRVGSPHKFSLVARVLPGTVLLPSGHGH